MKEVLVTSDKLDCEFVKTKLECMSKLPYITAKTVLEDINGKCQTLLEWAIEKGKDLNQMYDEYRFSGDYIPHVKPSINE